MRAESLVALLSAAAVAPTPVTSQQARGTGPEPVTVFMHVAVVPLDRERVLRDQTVVVRGNRILALGPARTVRVPVGATRIDGQGKYLMPGLADMHAHPLDDVIDWGDGHHSGLTERLFTYVANGVTTIRDMHSTRHLNPAALAQHPQPPIALKQQLMRGELLGPRLYTAGDPDLSSPEAAARGVAALKAGGYDFVKVSLEQGGLWPAGKPLYDSIIAAAHRVGLPVVGHVPMGFNPIQLMAPWASTEHLGEYAEYALGFTGRWSRDLGGTSSTMRRAIADTAVWMRPGFQLDPGRLRELARALKRHGVWTCPTLSVLLPIRAMADALAKDSTARPKSGQFAPAVGKRYLEMNFQTVQALQDNGAGLLLGTDASAFDIHPELAALVEAGLTSYQALLTGTRNVAQFLGTLDSTGTIVVGKRADLVLLSGNPLQDIGYTAGPAGVMIGGRWLSRADIDARLAAMNPSIYGLSERPHIWQH